MEIAKMDVSLTDDLDLDVDLDEVLGKRIDPHETRIDSARESAKLGDETDGTLRYTVDGRSAVMSHVNESILPYLLNGFGQMMQQGIAPRVPTQLPRVLIMPGTR